MCVCVTTHIVYTHTICYTASVCLAQTHVFLFIRGSKASEPRGSTQRVKSLLGRRGRPAWGYLLERLEHAIGMMPQYMWFSSSLWKEEYIYFCSYFKDLAKIKLFIKPGLKGGKEVTQTLKNFNPSLLCFPVLYFFFLVSLLFGVILWQSFVHAKLLTFVFLLYNELLVSWRQFSPYIAVFSCFFTRFYYCTYCLGFILELL